MPQLLSSILVHLIFSTKNREPFISLAIECELHPYMATIFREHNSPSIIDGTSRAVEEGYMSRLQRSDDCYGHKPGPLAQAITFRAVGA